MPRGRFEALRLDLADGERVHVFGRPELYEARGDFRLRALTIERFGLGDHLAALERLKRKLAAEGLFAPERKRPLPRLPRAVGLLTGNDAAAQRTLGRERDRLALLHDRLRRAPALAVERKRAALAQSAARLRALSPKATLTRGYAIVRTDTGIVRSPAAVRSGQSLRVEVAEGEFGARVE